jgi:hypothetical protein
MKYLLFLTDFNQTWIFSKDFRKILKYQISLKNRSVGAKLLHADRQTWLSKVDFQNFVNVLKEVSDIKGQKRKRKH